MEYGLLLARQRSGTGALGSVLEQHPQLKYTGEVFHPGNTGQAQNFFTFLRDAVAQDPDMALPTNRSVVFEQFLAGEAEQFGHKKLIVDIKYNSLHHLNEGWRGLAEIPTAILRAKQNSLPILHLTRRNAIQSFVSGRLAEANQVWHARDDEQIKTTSTVVNIRQMSRYLVNAEQETQMIEKWIKGYRKAVQFDYADMFEQDGAMSKDITGRIAEAADINPFENLQPNFVKQAPKSLEQSIENYDLVARALRGSPFEWMLDK
jgi:LPS sulfotransferase NodH